MTEQRAVAHAAPEQTPPWQTSGDSKKSWSVTRPTPLPLHFWWAAGRFPKLAEADFFFLSPAGICSRLQDMQRKGCSRMPRVQGTHSYYHGYAAVDFPFDVSDIAQNGIGWCDAGDRQEQEEWKHFREMEVGPEHYAFCTSTAYPLLILLGFMCVYPACFFRCFDCQGFGLKSCPSCGKGGLTPEQRGERWYECQQASMHSDSALHIQTANALPYRHLLQSGQVF